MTDVEHPQRMSDEQLKNFVIAYCDGRIFSSLQIQPLDRVRLGSVFMPIAFGALAGWSEAQFERIGLIWEFISEAGPMAVNGMPTFTSCRIMHRDDWERVREVIKRELDRRTNIEVP